MKLERGAVAVVTGAASGIGFALAWPAGRGEPPPTAAGLAAIDPHLRRANDEGMTRTAGGGPMEGTLDVAVEAPRE